MNCLMMCNDVSQTGLWFLVSNRNPAMLFSVGRYTLNIHCISPKAEPHFSSLFTIYITFFGIYVKDNHTMQSAMDVVRISDSIVVYYSR